MTLKVTWPWYTTKCPWFLTFGPKTQPTKILIIQGHTWKQHTEYSWATSDYVKTFKEYNESL